MKKTITSAQLQKIISESIVKTLNEMSPDFLMAAGQKAMDLGRSKQANAFTNYARETFSENAPQHNLLRKYGMNEIEWENDRGDRVGLTSKGEFWSKYGEGILGVSEIRQDMRTSDKKLARIIANWWKTRGRRDDTEAMSDWHYWANL